MEGMAETPVTDMAISVTLATTQIPRLRDGMTDMQKLPRSLAEGDYGLECAMVVRILCHKDADGLYEESIPPACSSYSQRRGALYETVAHGTPQLVTPEETMMQMRILGERHSAAAVGWRPSLQEQTVDDVGYREG